MLQVVLDPRGERRQHDRNDAEREDDRALGALEAAIKPGPWLFGDQFTAADLYIASSLGFGMMFFLTGVIFSMTSYPGFLRVLFCAWPLVFQMIDIGCWWLARLDPMYARVIVYTGGLVALGLGLQVVLTLLDLMIPRSSSTSESLPG